MIPSSYIPATWRNTLPVEASSESVGIGFNTNYGQILRFKLDIVGAKHLSRSIAEYLEAYGCRTSQSPKSSEIPSSPGSIPEEGQKV